MAGTGKRYYVAMAAELRLNREQAISFAKNPGLAGISKKTGVETLVSILDDTTRAVARVFAAGNPSFDYPRFLEAAGFGKEE